VCRAPVSERAEPRSDAGGFVKSVCPLRPCTCCRSRFGPSRQVSTPAVGLPNRAPDFNSQVGRGVISPRKTRSAGHPIGGHPECGSKEDEARSPTGVGWVLKSGAERPTARAGPSLCKPASDKELWPSVLIVSCSYAYSHQECQGCEGVVLRYIQHDFKMFHGSETLRY
jgi:hypothetical protein